MWCKLDVLPVLIKVNILPPIHAIRNISDDTKLSGGVATCMQVKPGHLWNKAAFFGVCIKGGGTVCGLGMS